MFALYKICMCGANVLKLSFQSFLLYSVLSVTICKIVKIVVVVVGFLQCTCTFKVNGAYLKVL